MEASKDNVMEAQTTEPGSVPGYYYTCSICNAPYKFLDSLNRHMKSTHKDPNAKKELMCYICGKKCTNLKRHLEMHDSRSGLENISNNMSRVKMEKYACNICEYRCSYKSTLNSHLRRHSGEKPYFCEVCGYNTASSSSLTRHMLTHTGEKAYYCEFCNYKTAQKGNLSQHVMTHSGNKPFQCSVCDYKCIRKPRLEMHMLKHCVNGRFGNVSC